MRQSDDVNLIQSDYVKMTQCIYTETIFFSPSDNGEKETKKIHISAFKNNPPKQKKFPKIKMSWEQIKERIF